LRIDITVDRGWRLIILGFLLRENYLSIGHRFVKLNMKIAIWAPETIIKPISTTLTMENMLALWHNCNFLTIFEGL
jgi:hypothetical protein